MANQMIALGVRGPQLPNLGNMAQQFANTMAATATARERRGAAERQMQFRQLVGSEGFDAGNPEHIRAAAALDPAGAEALGRSFTTRRAADQEFDTREMVRLRNLGVAVMRAADPEAAYQSWLTEVEAADPRSGTLFRQASPTYQPEFMTNVLMEADQYIDKSVSTPTSSVQFTPGGDAFEVNVGGVGDPTAREVIVTSRNGAPPTSTAGTPAARTPAAGTPAAETVGPARDGMGPQELIAADIPAENVPTGNPTVPPTPALTPASAGGGVGGVQPFTMETAPQIIQNAVQNRVIDQTHMQQLREMVGPENERNLAAWMQQNQIRIQPTGEAPIQPGMRSAEYRPDMAPAPQFQQVQSVNQVGTQFRGRDPMQSPAPGSANVPISRVEAEAAARRPSPAEAGAVARASRETPQEAAARAAASARATAEVNRETDTRTRNTGRRLVSTILRDLRNDYTTLNDMEAIPSTERGATANVIDYIGATRLGRMGQSMVGTRASRLLNTISNSRQLLTTAIKNATGMSAQQMNSNIELQLLLESLSDPTQGYESAIETIQRIENAYGEPSAAPAAARGNAARRSTAPATRTTSGLPVTRWDQRRR
jgi:hypothetical protein